MLELRWRQIFKFIELILFICLGGGIAFLFYKLLQSPDVFWSYIKGNKLIPRVIAWSCLILGLYGIARRRFSPTVTAILFGIAFFFAYLGKFFFKSLY